MTDTHSHDTDDTSDVEADGGVQTAQYLEREINFFRPATPFMRDHMKLIFGVFIGWVLFVFGPVTATVLSPDAMTQEFLLGFELHYFLTATMAPLGALLLSVVYAWRRDHLDRKYGISHEDDAGSTGAVATDGGDQ